MKNTPVNNPHAAMLSLETFESHICALMHGVVNKVTELSGLLERCSADTTAAQQRSSPATETALVREDEGEGEGTPPEEGQESRKGDIKNQLASLIEAWAKGAVKQIVAMVKLSMCVAEESAGPNEETEQWIIKPKARRKGRPKKQSTSASALRKRKKIQEGLELATGKVNENLNEPSVTDVATPVVKVKLDEGMLTELPSNMASPGSTEVEPDDDALTEPDAAPPVSEEEVIPDNARDSATKSKIKKKKPFKCPTCDKPFAVKCQLERHILTHTKPHLCSECGKRFAVQRRLIAHSRQHTGEKLHKCSDCGTEFAYKSTFERHLRQHCLLRLKKLHMCALCEEHFTGLPALQRHKCGALKKTLVCSLCPETFECREALADHENLHVGDRDFVCELCGESFLSSSSLTAHRVTHVQKENCCDLPGLGKQQGEAARRFPCEVCGKCCSHRSALKHHMLTHTGERPYVCDTCGKRCAHASALQNHMRVHTGKKPGQKRECSVCHKTFRSSTNFKYHMNVHTGEKPFACERCDKHFGNPSTLKVHMDTHSQVKLYGCSVCGRRFAQVMGLRHHWRMHTGERPFRCTVCGLAFMQRLDWKKHQREEHPAQAQPAGEEAVASEGKG